MSSKRFNVTAPRKYKAGGEDKTQWQRVGVAFENDKGGFDIQLDVIPLPEVDRKNDGQLVVRLKAFPADDSKSGGGRGGRSSGGTTGGGGYDDVDYDTKSDDDDVPF